MFSIKVLIIVIIILAILLTIALKIYKSLLKVSHEFWDKQPVSRNYKKKGMITSKKPASLHNKDTDILNFNLNNDSINRAIVEFLNNHFLKGYQYSLNFLKWSMSSDPHHLLTLINKSPRQLIGTIASRSINIRIDNTNIELAYVDYLSVHRNFRGKRLATLLISKVVESSQLKSFLFKIEDNPLPFDYICKYRYYVLNLSDFNITTKPLYRWNILDRANLKKCYRFYLKNSKSFKIAQNYTLEEFSNWFLPRNDVIYSYFSTINDNVVAFSSFFKNKISGKEWGKGKQMIVTGELLLHLSDNVTESLKSHIEIMKQYGIEYLVTTNLAKNRVFIDRLPFIPAKRCYLQMYNYGTLVSYNPQDILVNLP